MINIITIYFFTKLGRDLANNSVIHKIRDKEMNRRDFLKLSGLIVLSAVGYKTIANLLTQPDIKKALTDNSSDNNLSSDTTNNESSNQQVSKDSNSIYRYLNFDQMPEYKPKKVIEITEI